MTLLTERERQLLRREGYREGAMANEASHRASLCCNHWVHGGWREDAAKKYPLPKIKVERQEPCDIGWPGLEFRCIADRIEWRSHEFPCWDQDAFTRFAHIRPRERAKVYALWADLLEKPFREVPDHCLRPDDCRIGEKCCCLRPKP